VLSALALHVKFTIHVLQLLDVLLKLDTNGKITTQLMTNGMISISPLSTSLTCVVIFQLHLHMVHIYRSLFDMQELARNTISFKFEAVYLQTSWCHRGFNCLVYRQLSSNFKVVTTILFAHTTFLWATCCLICFIPIVKLFLTHGSFNLFKMKIGLTAGVTGQQGMLTPPWHLISPLIYSEVRVRPFSDMYTL
jgi:hypothetical protein